MQAIRLICSLLTLYSVSSADGPLVLTGLPPEMLDAIVRQVVVTHKFDFCGYVDWLAGIRWAWPCTDVGMLMLKEIAKEEEALEFENGKERSRKQQIITSVRTFARIHSGLPIDCTETDTNERMGLAKVFESNYEKCASPSESPTWKEACMAGLFGRNTLITLLEYLSDDFRQNTREILLQTAFFIGDIDSLSAITESFVIPKESVVSMVSVLDIVFSNSGAFFKELFKRLPNVMEHRLKLIMEACSLNCLDILLGILEVAKPVELYELDQILDSFRKLKLYENKLLSSHNPKRQVTKILLMAAQHGHFSIIQFLWPMMATMPNDAEMVMWAIMADAGRNNHCGVLEFLLWQSGTPYMQIAQKYVNNALRAAVKRGNIEIIKLLARKDKDGQFVAPGLRLTTLRFETLDQAIRINRNWSGIKCLVDLKEEGDSRFADLELVDQDNTALCMACEVNNYDLVENLLRRTPSGESVFLLTNPAAQNNQPLVNACLGGNVQIVEKLLERDKSGNYIYKDIDPSAQDYQSVVNACNRGHLDVVKVLLEVRNGKCVLPKVGGMDITRALTAAIDGDSINIVEFLFDRQNGNYVLAGMEGVNLTQALRFASRRNRIGIVRFLLRMENEKYVVPGMHHTNLTCVLRIAINLQQKELVEFLLSRALDGSYLHPGVGVTEDMLTIPHIGPEMREILERHLDQQRIKV